CHSSTDTKFARDLRDASNHGPHKRTLALPVCPGMIVVRNRSEGEPMFLSCARESDQFSRLKFFTRELIANLNSIALPHDLSALCVRWRKPGLGWLRLCQKFNFQSEITWAKAFLPDLSAVSALSGV